MNHPQSKFFRETDEFIQPIYFRSFENNRLLLNATVTSSNAGTSFDTDSFPIIIDTGASSTSTPYKSDFIPDSYKPLKGITISGIASGLKALGVGSILCKIKDDQGNLIDL